MIDPSQIASVAIYPPLGIARIGDSPEHFYASDLPGQAPDVEKGAFKDSQGRIKKQAARFRIYAFDKDQKVLGELNISEAVQIEWRVQVANRKAGWYQFTNALDLGAQAIATPPRNPAVTGEDRRGLVITPSPRRISGGNLSGPEYQFSDGSFRCGTMDVAVNLGELRTDEEGRLLVLGGDGRSQGLSDAITFANNDGWHDDVADGTVYATVTFRAKVGAEERTALEATPALVAVTPPNFAPGLFGVVTLYDVALDLFYQQKLLTPPARPEFWENIYPILARLVQTQWVNHGFYLLFGENSPSNYLQPHLLDNLKSTHSWNRDLRTRVYQWFRDPSASTAHPEQVPPFYGDAFSEFVTAPNAELPLTATQLGFLKQWADGDFTVSSQPKPVSFDLLTPAAQVAALSRAPLEECLGGPFHPGIELTWPLRHLSFWKEPFRPKVLPEGQAPVDDYGAELTPEIALREGGPVDGSGPGSLTRWLGVPWQTDEASCLSGYTSSFYLPLPSFWAARVPNQVLSEFSFARSQDTSQPQAQRLKHLDYRQDWLRDLGTQYQTRINTMIKNWAMLGIVTERPATASQEELKDDPFPRTYFVETGRGPFSEPDPTSAQVNYAEGVKQTQVLRSEPGVRRDHVRFGRDQR